MHGLHVSFANTKTEPDVSTRKNEKKIAPEFRAQTWENRAATAISAAFSTKAHHAC